MRVRSIALLILLVPAALALAGCPKRPVTTVAHAPAPAAPPSAPVTPAPAPAPVPPAAGAPRTPAPAPPPAPREYAENEALKDVRFDFDHAEIQPAAARVLDGTAAWLTANARQVVLVEGHSDERGSNEYNLALGERRARAAVAYLVRKGIEQARFTLISYGEERPSCTQKTEACWAANRRAHFLVKER